MKQMFSLKVILFFKEWLEKAYGDRNSLFVNRYSLVIEV